METSNKNNYPELEKERENMDKIRVLTEFFEWLNQSDRVIKSCFDDTVEDSNYLMYRFLGIDRVKLKLEREYSLKEYKK